MTDITQINNKIFSQPEHTVYTVLDGASIPGLPRKLEEYGVHYSCLFTGQLDAELLQVAPYMVQLEQIDSFTQWLLEKGWGEHWGIFISAPDYIAYKDIRRHLRELTQVRDPEGKVLFFRYYDPRVFRVFAPTCEGEEYEKILGPCSRILLEDEDSATMLVYSRGDGELLIIEDPVV